MVTRKASKTKAAKKAKVDDEVIEVTPLSDQSEAITEEFPLIVDEPPEIPDAPAYKEMSIVHIAGIAWDRVKGNDDASFATCAPEFRSNLIYHAEAVQKSGRALSSNTVLGDFEREVRNILGG